MEFIWHLEAEQDLQKKLECMTLISKQEHCVSLRIGFKTYPKRYNIGDGNGGGIILA